MSILALLAPYASLIAVLVTIIFGILTLRQWNRARHLASAAELVHTIQSSDFNRSIARIVALPQPAPVALVHDDPETAQAALHIGHVFESLGVLVFYRVLPLDIVDHLVGGYVRASWGRLKPYAEHRRIELGVMFAEWFQWLAERLEQHPARGKQAGAHHAFAEWKP